MNEKDLRVIKTRECIEEAFFELLDQKPLAKITVTELARKARINKGTFYRHYLDIYDLYDRTVQRDLDKVVHNADGFDDFFDDPEKFMVELDQNIMGGLQRMQLLRRASGNRHLQEQLIERLRMRIYATGRLERSVDTDMRLDAIFGATLSFMPLYRASHMDEAIVLAASLIRALFPSHTKAAPIT